MPSNHRLSTDCSLDCQGIIKAQEMEGQLKSYVVIYQKEMRSLNAIYVLMVNVLYDIQGHHFTMGDM